MTEYDFYKSICSSFQFSNYQELVEKLYLTAIVDSFQRIQNVPGIKDLIENKIRNHLAYDLEYNNKLLQPFLQIKLLKLSKENTILLSPTETKRTDIEFFLGLSGDFVIECKKLKSAEQRYINQGVLRFTEEYYSKDDPEGSMVGFVIDGNIQNIIRGLKSKVELHQPTTNCKNLLTQMCIRYQYSFHSEHSRKTKQPILIHHLFANLI